MTDRRISPLPKGLVKNYQSDGPEDKVLGHDTHFRKFVGSWHILRKICWVATHFSMLQKCPPARQTGYLWPVPNVIFSHRPMRFASKVWGRWRFLAEKARGFRKSMLSGLEMAGKGWKWLISAKIGYFRPQTTWRQHLRAWQHRFSKSSCFFC